MAFRFYESIRFHWEHHDLTYYHKPVCWILVIKACAITKFFFIPWLDKLIYWIPCVSTIKFYPIDFMGHFKVSMWYVKNRTINVDTFKHLHPSNTKRSTTVSNEPSTFYDPRTVWPQFQPLRPQIYSIVRLDIISIFWFGAIIFLQLLVLIDCSQLTANKPPQWVKEGGTDR